MRQEITRAHKGWALDNVALANDVTKMMKEDVSSAPAEGVYVHGLFLDGAGWDRRNCRLMEPAPKVLFTALPVVHVYAVNTAAMAKDSKDNKDALKFYECPVYKKPRRTDLTYIFCLNLKTSQHPDHWILRGVALLCDTKKRSFWSVTFLFVFLLSVKLSCVFFTNKESGSVSVWHWMSFLWELVSIQNRVHLTVFCISWSKKWNDALLTLVHFFFLEGKAFFSSSKTKRSKI